jgi:polyisoprenoid-binding protein YceI
MSAILETTEALPTGTWGLDAVHSRLAFAVDYLVGTFRGTFSPFAATLVVDDEGSATLAGSAEVTGIKVEEPNLVGHLLAPDFFDAERTPELRFTSTDVHVADGAARVRGGLTLRGVTREVELTGTASGPLTDPYGRERLGLRLATVVDRTQFGLEWNTPLPNGRKALADEVTLEAELFFVKE